MKHKVNIAWFFIIICYLAQGGIATENTDNTMEPSRPAVIGIIDITGREGKLSDLVSLMTARLSREANINLVEREEIGKVLEELELSASQLLQ